MFIWQNCDAATKCPQMPESLHPACRSVEELLADCDEIRTRRGGPGGQHRNKVSTAVVLKHRPSGIVSEASERRSQSLNRTVAIGRLRLRLATEIRSPTMAVSADASAPDDSTSDLWRRRRSATAIRVSAEHTDYPALVAEALDRLEEAHGSIPAAARRLGVSGSQFTRLFAKHPAAWKAMQSLRLRYGLPVIRQ